MGVGGEEGGGSPPKDIFLKNHFFLRLPYFPNSLPDFVFGGKITILFQLISASSVDFMPYLSIFLPSSLIKCIKALNAKKKMMTTFPLKIFHSQMHLKIKARG